MPGDRDKENVRQASNREVPYSPRSNPFGKRPAALTPVGRAEHDLQLQTDSSVQSQGSATGSLPGKGLPMDSVSSCASCAGSLLEEGQEATSWLSPESAAMPTPELQQSWDAAGAFPERLPAERGGPASQGSSDRTARQSLNMQGRRRTSPEKEAQAAKASKDRPGLKRVASGSDENEGGPGDRAAAAVATVGGMPTTSVLDRAASRLAELQQSTPLSQERPSTGTFWGGGRATPAWLLQQAGNQLPLATPVLSLHLPTAATLQQGTPTSRDGPPETPFGMAGAPTPAWLPQQTAQSPAPEAAQEGAAPTAVERALQRGLTPGFSGAASPSVSRVNSPAASSELPPAFSQDSQTSPSVGRARNLQQAFGQQDSTATSRAQDTPEATPEASRNSLTSSGPSPADSFPLAYRVSRSPSEDSKDWHDHVEESGRRSSSLESTQQSSAATGRGAFASPISVSGEEPPPAAEAKPRLLEFDAAEADPAWSRFQADAIGSDATAATAGTDAAEASSSGPSSPPTPSALSERSNTMDELSSEALASLSPADTGAEQSGSTLAPVETPARGVWFAEQQDVSTPAEAGAAAAAEAAPLPVEELFGDTTPAASAGQKWNDQTPAASVVQRHSLVTPGSRARTVLSWLRASLTPGWRKQASAEPEVSSPLQKLHFSSPQPFRPETRLTPFVKEAQQVGRGSRLAIESVPRRLATTPTRSWPGALWALVCYMALLVALLTAAWLAQHYNTLLRQHSPEATGTSSLPWSSPQGFGWQSSHLYQELSAEPAVADLPEASTGEASLDSWLESQWGAADQPDATQEAGTPPSDDADSTQREPQQAASEPASSRHMYTELAQHAKRVGNRASRLGRAAVADGSRLGAAIWQEAQRLQGAAAADVLRWGGQVQNLAHSSQQAAGRWMNSVKERLPGRVMAPEEQPSEDDLQAQAAEALSQVKGAVAEQGPQSGQAGAVQQPSKLDIAQGFARLHMNADDQAEGVYSVLADDVVQSIKGRPSSVSNQPGDSSPAWLAPSVDRIQATFGAVNKAASLPATAVGSHAAMRELRQEIAAQARERQEAAAEAAAQAAAQAAAEETADNEAGQSDADGAATLLPPLDTATLREAVQHSRQAAGSWLQRLEGPAAQAGLTLAQLGQGLAGLAAVIASTALFALIRACWPTAGAPVDDEEPGSPAAVVEVPEEEAPAADEASPSAATGTPSCATGSPQPSRSRGVSLSCRVTRSLARGSRRLSSGLTMSGSESEYGDVVDTAGSGPGASSRQAASRRITLHDVASQPAASTGTTAPASMSRRSRRLRKIDEAVPHT